MKEQQVFIADAFATEVFRGNPAAVMVLDDWWAEERMQKVAAEHNLSETAFAVRKEEGVYGLRWFTPTVEIPLCGHATLATAHILWTEYGEQAPEITFHTQSGSLTVRRVEDGQYALNLPADPLTPIAVPDEVISALGVVPQEVLIGNMTLAVLDDPETVRGLTPDFTAIGKLWSDRARVKEKGSIIVTAADRGEFDIVSRFFGPGVGIDEDPVTGSAHCALAPYWAARLGRSRLSAYQASARGGAMECEVDGDRVTLIGSAVTYLRGTAILPD